MKLMMPWDLLELVKKKLNKYCDANYVNLQS